MRTLHLGNGTGGPRMEPVDSAALAQIGYDADSRTLFIRFREGGLYAYLDVPPATVQALGEAPSKGAFFHAEIDPAFRYVRLDAT